MTRKLLPVALVLLPLILLSSCGPGKYRPKPNEELFGTWTNESYGTVNGRVFMPQKEIIDASGYEAYRNVSDHGPAEKGPESIASKWSKEGSTWYKTYGTASDSDQIWTFQALHRLSKEGTVRECVMVWLPKPDPDSYPTAIDPKDPSYRIYNRAGK
jgi:hypothetical protein